MDHLIHDPISVKDQYNWFNKLTKSELPFSIFIKKKEKANEIVGTVGLYNINMRHQRAVWRVRIDQKVQGKGIAFEAVNMVLEYGFNTINLNKIISDSFADNQAIIKLSAKLGFKQEGILKKHYFHKGEFKDAIQFGLTRNDFNK